MGFPNQTFAKYRARVEQLIAEGDAVPVRSVSVASGGNYLTNETYYRQEKQVDWSEFVAWRTRCITVLDQVVPGWSIHRGTVEGFGTLKATPGSLQFGIAFLKSILADLRDGFFERLASDLEAEISADYIGQAEGLLREEERAGSAAAVVLVGAVLENALRSWCPRLTPPEPIVNSAGHALTLTGLIDSLKCRRVFNEITAKQLRAWAAVRNSAAHGNFDAFTKEAAGSMVAGVKHFLAFHQ